MTRTEGNKFLGCEVSPQIYDAVNAVASRRKVHVSVVLREYITNQLVSSQTTILMEVKTNDSTTIQPEVKV